MTQFFSKCGLFLGDGRRINFWKDVGVVMSSFVLDTLLFSIWRQTKRPRLRTFGIEIGGGGGWDLVPKFPKTSQ